MIFLDMDGVLCDFASAAFDANGSRFDADIYPRGTWAIESVIGCSTNDFWKSIDAKGELFWENLKPYPWAIDLVNALQSIDKVVIATSPSRSPDCYSGKRKWLQKMGLHKLDSMFGSSKWLMSKPGRVLVDDAEHNIKQWSEHGGEVVLVPQPWNNADYVDCVVTYVVNELTQARKAAGLL